MHYTLKLYSSIETGRTPLPDMDINPDVTDLRWGTGVTGFMDLECGMASNMPYVVGPLPKPIAIPLRGHVEVWAGSQIVYEGRIVRRRRGGAGLYDGFVAEGYLSHLNDDWNRSTSTSSVSSGTALQQIVQSVAPYLRFGNSDQFVDPNITHSGGLNEFRRMMGGDVVDQITKEGNGDGEQVDIAIWENLTLWCLARTEPTTPHYHIPFDPRVVSWEEDSGRMASHVMVEYGDGATGTLTAEAETSGFLDDWGFVSKILIQAGDISANAAAALRDRELLTRSTPEIIALLSLESGEYLQRFNGTDQMPELVRSLEWVQVGDEPLQVIVGTTFDAKARTLAVELGSPSPYMPKNMNIRERDAVARLLRNVHPNSGGKVR